MGISQWLAEHSAARFELYGQRIRFAMAAFPGAEPKGTGAGGGNRTPDIQLGKLTFYL